MWEYIDDNEGEEWKNESRSDEALSKIISDSLVHCIDYLRKSEGKKEAVIERDGHGSEAIIKGVENAFERVDRRKEADDILNKILRLSSGNDEPNGSV
jgi:hypothetical protein